MTIRSRWCLTESTDGGSGTRTREPGLNPACRFQDGCITSSATPPLLYSPALNRVSLFYWLSFHCAADSPPDLLAAGLRAGIGFWCASLSCWTRWRFVSNSRLQCLHLIIMAGLLHCRRPLAHRSVAQGRRERHSVLQWFAEHAAPLRTHAEVCSQATRLY